MEDRICAYSVSARKPEGESPLENLGVHGKINGN
jgi:hypothetical protein